VHEPWTVRLEVSNYRPDRQFVTVERVDEHSVIHGGCVGFSDDETEARTLFEAVGRAITITTGGKPDYADWAEVPPGSFLE
jgi:hypothetical protein